MNTAKNYKKNKKKKIISWSWEQSWATQRIRALTSVWWNSPFTKLRHLTTLTSSEFNKKKQRKHMDVISSGRRQAVLLPGHNYQCRVTYLRVYKWLKQNHILTMGREKEQQHTKMNESSANNNNNNNKLWCGSSKNAETLHHGHLDLSKQYQTT